MSISIVNINDLLHEYILDNVDNDKILLCDFVDFLFSRIDSINNTNLYYILNISSRYNNWYVYKYFMNKSTVINYNSMNNIIEILKRYNDNSYIYVCNNDVVIYNILLNSCGFEFHLFSKDILWFRFVTLIDNIYVHDWNNVYSYDMFVKKHNIIPHIENLRIYKLLDSFNIDKDTISDLFRNKLIYETFDSFKDCLYKFNYEKPIYYINKIVKRYYMLYDQTEQLYCNIITCYKNSNFNNLIKKSIRMGYNND